MAKQAVHQAITYYSPDEPSGKVIEGAPLAARGKVWTLGSYKHPTYPSPLNVRVGDAGIKVWMVIELLQAHGESVDDLARRYGDTLTREDIEAAMWYYRENKEMIERKLKEEEGA